MKINDFEETIAKLKPFLPQYLEEKGIDPTKHFRCIFPGHNDSDPSCTLIGAGTSSPRVFCFGCGRSCDLFDAVQILENRPGMGPEWIEDTLKYLAEKYGVEVHTKDLTEEQIYELDTYRVYRAAASLIKNANFAAPKFEPFLNEVKKRGWQLETLTEMGVGTVSSFTEFRQALKDLGFSATFLDEVDLGRKDIFNENNMIFTWRDDKGRPIGFTSRNLFYEQEKEEAEKEGKKCTSPKYNNQRTTGLKCNIFQKGKRLYGIDKAVRATPPLYIFEGQADVITAVNNGLLNCVAIAGSSLSTDHVFLLKELGIYDVILALDGDETGQKKLAQILEEKFAGHRDMRVRVVNLPAPEDPDSFIRKEGIEAFKSLACWTAFEWRLNQYEENDDPSIICQQMIPFIVNEPSPVVRENQCKILARRTGVTLKSIFEELNLLLDAKSHQRIKERQKVVERTIFELQKNPSDAELIIQKTRANLLELNKKHDRESLSNEDFVRILREQKQKEENYNTENTGFSLGPDLKQLEEALRGEWSKDVFMVIGGKENVGKSGLLCKIAHSIATYNEDVCVLYHTIDDTAEQLVPRFVCIAEGSRKLTINMVRQPKYWETVAGIQDIKKRRDKGYSVVKKLAQDGKLIIKDANYGGSLVYAESLIQFFKEKYPERKIVYILDNFHKLSDFNGTKDERIRFKQLSDEIKDIATRYHITVLSSVEYTKLPSGVKPTNHNIAETVGISYDTNFIAHLYSEMSDLPDSFTVCHRDINWKGERVLLPRIEINIGKNKITEFKGHLYFDFWPASSDFKFIDQETVVNDAKKMKENRGIEVTELNEMYK